VIHQDGIFFSMDQDWLNSFREKLDQHYAWPSLYIFKFIVPAGKEDEVKKLFPNHNTSEKPSKNGNYISVTVQMMMPSSDSVIKVYVNAATIEGLIAL
jgi:putative lipoic acid-binding regulatory protein